MCADILKFERLRLRDTVEEDVGRNSCEVDVLVQDARQMKSGKERKLNTPCVLPKVPTHIMHEIELCIGAGAQPVDQCSRLPSRAFLELICGLRLISGCKQFPCGL